MKLTTLFRLRKPDGTDPVNIEDFNDNFDVIDEELGKRLESTGAASDLTVAFEQASTRTNLKTGEKISASFGKIMKWFADLKAVAFSGSYNDLSNKPTIPSLANNCTTTAAGYGLDARQGKALNDRITQVSQSFQDGCDTIVAGCTSCGSTPSSNSPSAIVTAIKNIYNNRYNAGVSATKKGTATAGNVLSGKTFTSTAGVNLSGTMANRGALNWNPSGSESKTVSAGYYSGGTLSTANAYNAGVSAGKATVADLGVINASSQSGSNTRDSTFKLTKYSGYKNISTSNIIFMPVTWKNNGGTGKDMDSFWGPQVKSYDASTGTVTLRGASGTNYGWGASIASARFIIIK